MENDRVGHLSHTQTQKKKEDQEGNLKIATTGMDSEDTLFERSQTHKDKRRTREAPTTVRFRDKRKPAARTRGPLPNGQSSVPSGKLWDSREEVAAHTEYSQCHLFMCVKMVWRRSTGLRMSFFPFVFEIIIT